MAITDSTIQKCFRRKESLCRVLYTFLKPATSCLIELLSKFSTYNVQSNPYIMFAANLQPSWPSRPKTKGPLLFYFLRLYNFGFYEIFVESTSSELQHPWISKISCEPKKSRKNNFSGSILKYF